MTLEQRTTQYCAGAGAAVGCGVSVLERPGRFVNNSAAGLAPGPLMPKPGGTQGSEQPIREPEPRRPSPFPSPR